MTGAQMRRRFPWTTSLLGTLLAVVTVRGLSAPERSVDVRAAVAGLASPEPAKRVAAAEVLGASFPEGARGVPALLEARRDEDASVREAVQAALRRLAEDGFVEAARLVESDLAPTDRWMRGLRELIQGDAFTLHDIVGGWTRDLPLTSRVACALLFPVLPREVEPRDLVAIYSWALDDPSPVARRAVAAGLCLIPILPRPLAPAPARVRHAEESLRRSYRRFADAMEPGPDGGRVPGAGRFLPAGLLGLSPSPGAETAAFLAADAEDSGSEWPQPSWSALVRLAPRSEHAGAAVRTAASRRSTLHLGEARALVASGAEDDVVARLASKDPGTRVSAAVALVEGRHVTPDALDVLVKALGNDVGYWLWDAPIALARSGEARRRAKPALLSLWNEQVEREKPGRPERGLALAWLVWLVDPDRVDAQTHVSESLRVAYAGSDSTGLSDALPSLLAVLGSDPELTAARSAVMERMPDVVARLHDGKGPLDGEDGRWQDLVDSAGTLGAAARALAPSLASALDRTVSWSATQRRALEPDDLKSSAAKLDYFSRGEKSFEFLRIEERGTAIALVNAIERIGVFAPATAAALDRADSLGGDDLHVAVARAERVLRDR
jgi:hypothetical protein